jgi:hypothetical protein
MADGKQINWTAILLALLAGGILSFIVYVFYPASSPGPDDQMGAGTGGPEPEPAPVPFEKPVSEVLVAGVSSNAIVGYAINAQTGLVIDPANPSRVIGGSNNPRSWVGVRSPFGIAVDSGGKIFVSNQGDAANPPSVTLFPASADGPNPGYDIHTGPASELVKPQGIALRRNPRSLLVSNWIDPPIPGQVSSVLEFSTQPVSGVPSGRLAGATTTIAAPMGVALDVSTRVYVADAASNRVLVFQPQPGSPWNGAPLRVIAGAQTLLDRPAHVAVDGQGNLYVTNLRGNKSRPGYITVYAPDADGNVAPTRTLGVPGGSIGNTTLRHPFGVAVHAAGTLFVTDDDELLVFAAGATGNDSPAQRIQHPKLNYATAVAVRDP